MSQVVVSFFNFLLFVASAAFIAGATWHLGEFAALTSMTGFMLYVLIFGIYLLVTVIVGVCGMRRQNAFWMGFYLVLLFMLLMLCMALAIALQVYNDQTTTVVASQWGNVQKSTGGRAMNQADVVRLLKQNIQLAFVFSVEVCVIVIADIFFSNKLR